MRLLVPSSPLLIWVGLLTAVLLDCGGALTMKRSHVVSSKDKGLVDYEITNERHPDMLASALRGLRQCCHGQCVLQTFILYMLLQQSLASADTSLSSTSDIQALESARWQCYDACCSLLAYEEVNTFNKCLLECFLLKKRLSYMSVASLLREAQMESCKDRDMQFQFERQTERMRFVIPQKRRWGNTIAPCISTHCTGLRGSSRVECIVNRCNGNGAH